ncbi:MAG: hypothetical protein WC686_05275 [Candidatus Shapirobacteria bacterium]
MIRIRRLAFPLILAVSLLFRLYLVPSAYHVDIFSQAGWGQWLSQNPPSNFYTHNVWVYSWPTQPPLVNLLYSFSYQVYLTTLEFLRQSTNFIVRYHLAPGHLLWYFEFVKSFDQNILPTINFPVGFVAVIKFWAIISDLLIAIIIYAIGRRFSSRPLLYPCLYLFSPFSWYLSSLWGQYDQLAFLFTFLSFLLVSKNIIASLLLLLISVSLKPTSLILFPFYSYLLLHFKPPIKSLIIGTLITAVFTYLTLFPFLDRPLPDFISHVLYPKIFQKAELRVSTNAYNFWHIFTLDKNVNQNSPFLFLPTVLWGLLAYFVLHLLVLRRRLPPLKLPWLFSGLYLIGSGSFLFMTGMLDRYHFIGVTSLLILSIFSPRLLFLWIPASLIYWLNLYRQWWFPVTFEPLRGLLTWQNGLIGGFLSLANVIIFLLSLRLLFPHSRKLQDQSITAKATSPRFPAS